MRISVLWATFVASVLLISVVSVHAQGQAQPQATTPPTAGGGTSVAVIDIGSIFRNHERFKAAMDDIKKDFQDFEKFVRDEQAVMVKKTEEIKSLPAASPQYRELEEEIANKSTTMRLEVGAKQKERVEKEAKIYFNAYKEIEWHVGRFADRYGVDMVVRFNSEEMDVNKPESVLKGINRFIVFHRNLNITNHILSELNRGTPPNPRVSGGGSPPAIPRGPVAPR